MPRALWWFRMAAVLTVFAGLAYWGNIVGSDARNGGGSAGHVMMSFFVIWTVVWGILYAVLIPEKAPGQRSGDRRDLRHRRRRGRVAVPQHQ